MKKLNFLMAMLMALAVSTMAQDKSTSTGSLQLKIDVADDNGVDAITQVVILRNLVASEIEPFIQARLSRYGTVQVNDPTNTIIITDKPIKVKDLVSLVQKLDETGIKEFLRLETEAVKLSYIAPSKIRPYIEKRLSPEGFISYNDELNLLIITDLKSRISNIKKILPQFDVAPKQVVIELKVYDITLLNSSKIGIEPFELMKNIDGRFDASWNFTKYSNSSSSINRNASMGIYADVDGMIVDIEQTAAENQNTLVANPIIMVQNRCWGRISSDVHLYYGDGGYNYYYQYYQDIMYFSVYPKITESGIVELNAEIHFDNDNETSYSNELDSYVTTTNNKTVLLGKISKKVEKRVHQGIPFLKSIPVLGFLFGKVKKTYENHQFMVLATPHIYEAGTGMIDSLKIK